MKDENVEKTINEIRSALERGEAIEVRPVPNEPPAFELDLLKAWRTLLNSWKKIVSITLIFAVIGVIVAGIYYSIPKPSPTQHFVQYIGVEINIEDPYDEIFSNADQYHNKIITYIDALQSYVASKEYGDKDADKEYLINLKDNINKSYTKTFLLAEKLYRCILLFGMMILRKSWLLLSSGKNLTKEINSLQQELSYLTSIASAGASSVGSKTDSAIAKGVEKARKLAVYQQEYKENAQLINELSGVADNSKRVQHMERIEKLIDKAFLQISNLRMNSINLPRNISRDTM